MAALFPPAPLLFLHASHNFPRRNAPASSVISFGHCLSSESFCTPSVVLHQRTVFQATSTRHPVRVHLAVLTVSSMGFVHQSRTFLSQSLQSGNIHAYRHAPHSPSFFGARIDSAILSTLPSASNRHGPPPPNPVRSTRPLVG